MIHKLIEVFAIFILTPTAVSEPLPPSMIISSNLEKPVRELKKHEVHRTPADCTPCIYVTLFPLYLNNIKDLFAGERGSRIHASGTTIQCSAIKLQSP